MPELLKPLNSRVTVYESDREDEIISCILGSASDLALVDTVPSPHAEAFVHAVHTLGHPRFIFHNHGHNDHCAGDVVFPNSQVILFNPQQRMIEIELQRLPDFQWTHTPLVLQPGIIQFGGIPIQVEHVGGHSFDTMFFLLPEDGILLAGENAANGRGGKRSVPHISRFGDPRDMLAALAKFEVLRYNMLVPAHGEAVSGNDCQRVIQDNIHYLTGLIDYYKDVQRQCESKEDLYLRLPVLERVVVTDIAEYTAISPAFHRKNWIYLVDLLYS